MEEGDKYLEDSQRERNQLFPKLDSEKTERALSEAS